MSTNKQNFDIQIPENAKTGVNYTDISQDPFLDPKRLEEMAGAYFPEFNSGREDCIAEKPCRQLEKVWSIQA